MRITETPSSPGVINLQSTELHRYGLLPVTSSTYWTVVCILNYVLLRQDPHALFIIIKVQKYQQNK